MTGYILKYSSKPGIKANYVLRNLLGRRIYRDGRYRGKYVYYVPGFLYKTKYAKVGRSEYYVESLDDIDMDVMNLSADIEIIDSEKPKGIGRLYTDEEYVQRLAKEKGIGYKRRIKPREKTK